MPEPILLSWSGGKDSALALYELRRSDEFDVVGLLTTVTADTGRIGAHAVRRELLDRQARALSLPVTVVEIPARPSNDEYTRRMLAALEGARERGVGAVAFGDLLLEDVRRFREEMLAAAGMRAVFPLWASDTGELARRFSSLGFRARIACVDSHVLDRSYAGRPFDAEMIRDLPAGVDPCGENGEFHTFVCAGPGFAAPVEVRAGAVALADGRFWTCDLVPG